MVGEYQGNRRGYAVFAVAIVVAAISLNPAGPANADDRPLAVLADTALPATPPESAIQRIEALNRLMLKDPTQWSGVWYDQARKQVVAAVPPGASERTRSSARSAVGSAGTLQSAARSFADLAQLSREIIERPTIASVPIVSTALDWKRNSVIVGLETITDDARAALAAEYGDAVTVRQMPKMVDYDGPDRWRDRYPYWGGSGWSAPRAGSLHCSTAFPMKRPDGSKHFMVTAGHCNHPYALDAATLNTTSTSWSNLIGTSKGYQNSLCASTGSSCDIGSTKYGDISVIKVDGNEARIYTGGSRGTTSTAVVSTQTGHPAELDSMCVSGATSGATCGYKVINNFTMVRNIDGQLRSPVVLTHNTSGHCSRPGDSGGAVYRPVSGGATASGILSGGSGESGDCFMAYTSIYYAQQLFDAVTVTS